MRFNLQVVRSNLFSDKAGIVVSWLCAAHCLILPLAAAALPFWGLSFLINENAERLMIAVSILIAIFALLPAYFRQHRRFRILVLFFFGIGFIAFSHLFLEESFAWKIPFVAAGAIFISAAHLFNRNLCRNCRTCRQTESKS